MKLNEFVLLGFPFKFKKGMRRKRKSIELPEEIRFVIEDYFKDRGFVLK